MQIILCKLQRNKGTSLRRKAIISFFGKKSLAQDQDRSGISGLLFARFCIQANHSRPCNNVFSGVNDRVITDKPSIANVFNKHFVNITSDTKELESNFGANFEDHPGISVILANVPEDASSNFNFTLFNTVTVEKCLQEIRVNKSSGYHNITPGFSRAMFHLQYINYSGSLSKQLEEGSSNDYSPIFVLPAINNVFEKLLTTH